MRNLKKRLLFSAVFTSLAIYAIFFAPMWLFFLISEALILLSLNEFFSLVEKKGVHINRFVGLFFGALMPLTQFFGSDALVLAVAFLTLCFLNFLRIHQDDSLIRTAVTMLGIVWVAWFFSHLGFIRELEHGAQWVFFVILVVKGGDACAYFVGENIGKTKLIEHVSPNKTVEGATAALCGSLVIAALSSLYLPPVGIFHLLILGALCAFLALTGDLSESLIKREVGVKDSGVIPGLGGILDMLDSLLLTIPMVYYYLTLILKISHV